MLALLAYPHGRCEWKDCTEPANGDYWGCFCFCMKHDLMLTYHWIAQLEGEA
jgi:hypothetical protein